MDFWDFCAPIYDIAEKTNGKAYGGMLARIRERVPESAEVLELAAGTGSISLAIAGKAKRIVCTDYSESMLKVARRKAARQGASDIEFARCDIYQTGFPDGAFDVVIASQVLHLLDEPERAAAELKRITRSLVIAPVAMLQDVSLLSRAKVGVWRLLGFAPKREFGEASYRDFLRDIGLESTQFEIAEGAMPLAIPVWEKPRGPA